MAHGSEAQDTKGQPSNPQRSISKLCGSPVGKKSTWEIGVFQKRSFRTTPMRSRLHRVRNRSPSPIIKNRIRSIPTDQRRNIPQLLHWIQTWSNPYHTFQLKRRCRSRDASLWNPDSSVSCQKSFYARATITLLQRQWISWHQEEISTTTKQ